MSHNHPRGLLAVPDPPEQQGVGSPLPVQQARKPGDVGSAGTPEEPEVQAIIDESAIVDLPTLVAAYKKVDIGWAMAEDQLRRTAEPKFAPPLSELPPRRPNVLLGTNAVPCHLQP